MFKIKEMSVDGVKAFLKKKEKHMGNPWVCNYCTGEQYPPSNEEVGDRIICRRCYDWICCVKHTITDRLKGHELECSLRSKKRKFEG